MNGGKTKFEIELEPPDFDRLVEVAHKLGWSLQETCQTLLINRLWEMCPRLTENTENGSEGVF